MRFVPRVRLYTCLELQRIANGPNIGAFVEILPAAVRYLESKPTVRRVLVSGPQKLRSAKSFITG